MSGLKFGLDASAINIVPQIKVEPGTYVEEHFLVRYNGYIHTMGVITKVHNDGNVTVSATTNSVTREEWGLPWDQRENALRNIYASKPKSHIERIN